jgi:dsDNA-specific endonuclease/ATPase MutS2
MQKGASNPMFDERRHFQLQRALTDNEQEAQALSHRLGLLAVLQKDGKGHYGPANEEVHRLLDMLVEQQKRLTCEALTTVQQATQEQRQQLAQFYTEIHTSQSRKEQQQYGR